MTLEKIKSAKVGELAEINLFGQRLNLKIVEVKDNEVWGQIGIFQYDLIKIFNSDDKDLEVYRIDTADTFYDKWEKDTDKYL